MKKERNKNLIQPTSGTKHTSFAGLSTFVKLPELKGIKLFCNHSCSP
jgi:agmatinase